MTDVDWQLPAWAWLSLMPLVLVPVWWDAADRRRQYVAYSSTLLIQQLPVSWGQRCKQALPWMSAPGMALILIAISRPRYGIREYRLPRQGIAIQMCIDRSGSMRAMDFQWEGQPVNRLQAVKRVFRQFLIGGDGLKGRESDQVGLITFGGFAECRAPLTLDHHSAPGDLGSNRVARADV